MDMKLPDPALTERFLRDWHAATGTACAERALVALSGGPDSTALLLLIAGIAAYINQPHAATVDHGIRAASSAEAGAAADLCRAAGIPHAILRGPLPERAGATTNLSARARELRYTLLAEHAEAIGARWIVTAHHADDQLETLVMRLNRGSGVRGLAAIRHRSDRIVRPLLHWRRAELASLVEACGVTAVNDPSNVDDRFDRARLRKDLAGIDWIDPLMVSRSVAALGEADDAMEWMADQLEAEHCQFGDGAAWMKHLGIPSELARRLVERCLRHVDPGIAIRGGDLTRLVAALERTDSGTLGRVRCSHAFTAAPVPQMLWTFRQAPPRRSH